MKYCYIANPLFHYIAYKNIGVAMFRTSLAHNRHFTSTTPLPYVIWFVLK